MTSVGLLGLAVGHGLGNDKDRPAGERRPRDEMILKGFRALVKHLGDPVGRMNNIPIQNLYFLWSVERVAVLYNVPTIGKKDWYRWGVEMLVANQSPATGEWPEGGGYPGANPTIKTCFALLFLRGANLASDLTDRLPFDPRELVDDVLAQGRADKPAPAPQPGAGAPPVQPSPPPVQAAQPPAEQEPGTKVEPGPTQHIILSPKDPLPTPPAETEAPKKDNKTLLIGILIGGLVLLVAGSGLMVFLLVRGKEDRYPPRRRARLDDEEDERPQRRPARRRKCRARYEDEA
jgi:hypothetical protein